MLGSIERKQQGKEKPVEVSQTCSVGGDGEGAVGEWVGMMKGLWVGGCGW